MKKSVKYEGFNGDIKSLEPNDRIVIKFLQDEIGLLRGEYLISANEHIHDEDMIQPDQHYF